MHGSTPQGSEQPRALGGAIHTRDVLQSTSKNSGRQHETASSGVTQASAVVRRSVAGPKASNFCLPVSQPPLELACMVTTAVCAHDLKASRMKQYATSSSVMPVYRRISARSSTRAPFFHQPAAVWLSWVPAAEAAGQGQAQAAVEMKHTVAWLSRLPAVRQGGSMMQGGSDCNEHSARSGQALLWNAWASAGTATCTSCDQTECTCATLL